MFHLCRRLLQHVYASDREEERLLARRERLRRVSQRVSLSVSSAYTGQLALDLVTCSEPRNSARSCKVASRE